MATITFYLKKSAKKNDRNSEASIYLRFRNGRTTDLTAPSRISINPNNWNIEKQCLKTTVLYDEQERIEFNKTLSDLREHVGKEFIAMNDAAVNKEWLEVAVDKFYHPENHIAQEDRPKRPLSLFEYVDDFIEQAPHRKHKRDGTFLSYNNIQQYRATYKHLKEFARIVKRKDFEFSDINEEFYNKFIHYLQMPIEKKDRLGITENDDNGNAILIKPPFRQSSVGKHIRILKLMLNDAPLELVKQSDYRKFYVFNTDADTIYLTETELKQMQDLDLASTPSYDRVRDWFLLLAWTGCRYSDLAKIGNTEIKEGFITITQQKTKKRVKIPLHPTVVQILQKYKYDVPEPISNQRFNEWIKDIAKMADITSIENQTEIIGGVSKESKYPKYKLVSSHTGRRSFCTNMYKKGIPTYMIMAISGHKTEKSFLKYLRIKDDEHAEMLQKRWQEMYQ